MATTVQRPNFNTPATFYTSVDTLCSVAIELQAQANSLETTLSNQAETIGGHSQSIPLLQTGVTQLSDALAALVKQLAAVQSSLNQQINAAISTEAGQRNKQFVDILQTFDDLRTVLSGLQSEADGRLDVLEASSGDLTTRLAAVTVQANALTTALTAQRFEFAIVADRPGCVPARFTFVSSASQLGGSRQALPLLPDALLAVSDMGPVVRVRGSIILAQRQPIPLEDGRLYRFRYAVQRRIDPTDPTGDAVVCGLAYLDQSFRMLGDVVVLKTYPSLVKANGRRVFEALVARTAGVGATFSPPDSNARFAVPVVVTYGPDALTDIDVLGSEDVTGFTIASPSVADFEARLAAIESLNVGARLDTAESQIDTPSKLTFPTKGDASAATIPATVQMIELLGRGTAGDGGQGLYMRISGTPANGADTFTSDGAVFQRVVFAADVAAAMIGSGFVTWFNSLPTTPPTVSGVAWNNGGAFDVSP